MSAVHLLRDTGMAATPLLELAGGTAGEALSKGGQLSS